MEVVDAILFYATVSFKKQFEHAAFTRESNQAFFLKLIDKSGKFGWGECLPREYVTGETTQTAQKNLIRHCKRIKARKKFSDIEQISQFLDELEPAKSRNLSALCATDMALLDLFGKSTGQSISQILYPNKEDSKQVEIRSGPLSLSSPAYKKNIYLLLGLDEIKLKISPETEAERINKIGSGIFGSKFLKPTTLRLDGNMAFTRKTLEDLLSKVKVPIYYIEQPFPTTEEQNFPEYRIMVDESLISLEDAEKGIFDAANIRLGKNGGFLRTKAIAKTLERRDIPYMVGSLVGESSLLSAALLHFSSGLNHILMEGCYSPNILKTDPAEHTLKIGYNGSVKFDYSSPGIGNSAQPGKANLISVVSIN